MTKLATLFFTAFLTTTSGIAVFGVTAANAQSAATDTASGKSSAARDPNARGAGSINTGSRIARGARRNAGRALHPRHADAYAQAPGGTRTKTPDPMQMRQDCYGYAKTQVPSGSQDKQKDRDFMYSTCAFDHGIMP